MSDRPFSPRLPARSMGLKLLLVCALALLMSIPALFVFAILADRTNRAEEVTQELGQLSGGPQTFLGPVLAVPYRVPPGAASQLTSRKSSIAWKSSGSVSPRPSSEDR